MTNIEKLIELLPNDYEKSCYETKAIERTREIKTPRELIEYALMYLIGMYSLVEMSAYATLSGKKISNVAFMKKFAKCNDWYVQMINDMRPAIVCEYRKPIGLEQYELVAPDASKVTSKGKNKQTFNLHYMLNVCKLSTEQLKITNEKTGESLENFNIKSNYLILADRAYGTIKSINYCLENGANFIFRMRNKAFTLYDENGDKITLLNELLMSDENNPISFFAYINNPNGGRTKVRICAKKKPIDSIEKCDKAWYNQTSKNKKAPCDDDRIINHYIIVVTSLSDISAHDILETYRLRWQVELYFKRLKSILDFAEAPNKKEDNIIAWLNGKMLTALLLERLQEKVNFSPTS
jgi:hypothetical protein